MEITAKKTFTCFSAPVLSICLTVMLGMPAIAKKQNFFIKPYIQIGNNPHLADKESEEVVWFSQNNSPTWKVETKQNYSDWRSDNTALTSTEIFNGTVHPLHKFTCQLTDLKPGTTFDYRIMCDGELAMASWAKSRKSASQPYSFSVFGDCGAGTVGEKLIAWQCYSASPDFIVVPGDIVYSSGLFSEYMSRFFPVYNNNTPDQLRGVPLMRSVPMIGVVGNHDTALNGGNTLNFKKRPDALAYYEFWNPPLNGPITSTKSKQIPQLTGAPETYAPFLKSVGDKYPRTGMFSFDYGNSHWLALDGNSYMNWQDKELREWVENDLSQSHATWKFVTYHEPGFSYDTLHAKEQRMRLLADIFQRTGVDIVFAGHAHDYQRTHPLTFTAKIVEGRAVVNEDGTVPGEIELDNAFDGEKHTVPHGVLHIVTGGGGAMLYGPKRGIDKTPEFLDKFVSNTHSLTQCSVNGSQLQFSQIGENGELLDHFVIDKK